MTLGRGSRTGAEPVTSARTYGPDSRLDIGWLSAFVAIAREVLAFRSHVATLFQQDFRNSYHGTTLGVFWNFVLPVLPITVYVLLSTFRVFPSFDGVAAAAYISFGVSLWFLIAGCIQQPIQVVRSRNAEVMKTALPLSAMVVSSFARLCFDTLIRIAAVILIIFTTGSWPAASAGLVVVVLMVLVVLGLGLGLCLAILNVIYPDVERVVVVILQYGIFASGVIFPLTSLGPLSVLQVINPFAVLIAAARDIVFHGHFSQPLALAIVTAFSLALALFATRLFYVMEYRIRGLA